MGVPSTADRPISHPQEARTSKEYYSGSRSIGEWRELTEVLLQGNNGSDFTHPLQSQQEAVGLAVEAARFWTTQRTPEGVRYGWKLWDRLETWCKHPEDATVVSDEEAVARVTTGRYPQLLHLLNAVVDSWRIVWESQQARQQLQQQQQREQRDKLDDVVDSPQRLFVRLQSVDPRFVSSRTFTILITAVLSTVPPNRRQHGPDRQRRRAHRQTNESSNTSDLSTRADEAPVLCEQIFHHMLALSSSSPPPPSSRSNTNPAADVFPDAIAFTSVLNAWAKSGHPDAPVRALGFWSEWELRLQQRTRALQERMPREPQQQYPHNNAHNASLLERSTPNVFSYNTLIRALCSTLDRAWIGRAGDVVHGMMGIHPHQLHPTSLTPSTSPHGAPDIPKPNEATFRLIIGACAAIRDAKQGSYWLKAMLESGLGHADAFSKVILSAYLSKQYDVAEAAHLLLVEAIESPLVSDVNDMSPHVALTMMRLYADTNRPHLAQAQLEQAEKATRSSDASALQDLDRSYYHNVLYGWINAVASSSSSSRGQGRPRHAAPFVTKRHAAEHTERLLVRMIEVSKRDNESVWADGRAIDSVLNLWARSVDEFVPAASDGGDHPVATLGGVPNGSSNLPDSRESSEVRAEALLRLLQSLGPADKLQVTSSSYFQVMSAWSRSRDNNAVDRVMSLLREVEDDPALVPTRLHYTVAIKACADRYREEDPVTVMQRLESIFDMAFQQVAAGNEHAAPDASMMGTLLHAYARLGSGDAAERVLDAMLLLQPPSRRGSARVSTTTIREANLVLLAWLRSNDADPRAALAKCESHCRRMEDLGLFLDGRSKRIMNELRQKADEAYDNAMHRPQSRRRAN
jgi:PPR repeat